MNTTQYVEHRRYCPGCGGLNVGVVKGKFIEHPSRDGKKLCVYAGWKVAAANDDAKGYNQQTKIGA